MTASLLCVVTSVLSAIAEINNALDLGSATTTFSALDSDDACLQNLDEQCKEKYMQALAERKAAKHTVSAPH